MNENERVDMSIHISARKGRVKAVELLLNSGTDIEVKNRYGSTPMYIASARGHIDVVKLLLNHGADIEMKDNYGWTALHVASVNGHVDVEDVNMPWCKY